MDPRNLKDPVSPEPCESDDIDWIILVVIIML